MKVKNFLSSAMAATALVALGAVSMSFTMMDEPPASRVVEEGGTGPYKAIMKEEPSLDAHTVFVPQDLSAFNEKKPLPVLVWGNGACTNSPWEHYLFLNEIASHGYIVVATGYFPKEDGYRGPMSTTEQQIESMDWVEKVNADKNSPYYGKIDLKNICVAGMSCGGLQTLFNCADKRIKALMICNSGLFNQQNAGNTAKSVRDIMAAYNSQSKIQLYDDSSAMSNDGVEGVGVVPEHARGPRQGGGDPRPQGPPGRPAGLITPAWPIM